MKKVLVCIVCLFLPFTASSKVYVNIGAPEKVKKSLIALSPFVLQDLSPDQDKLSMGKQMSERLGKNLSFSAYFNLLSPKAFMENPVEKSSVPFPKDPKGFRWQNWKLVGADFLFFANYSVEEDKLLVNASLHHIHLQKTLFRKKYKGEANHAKQIVDKLSNDIVKSLTGKKGVFETKILSVKNTSSTKKELFVMDWNGENKKETNLSSLYCFVPRLVQ